MRAAAERNRHLVRPQIKWLAEMLDDGRPYLLGDAPCIADFAAYHVVWFYRGRKIDCRAELDPYPEAPRLARPHGRDRPWHAHRHRLPTWRWPKRAPRRRAKPRPSDPQDGDPRPGERARVRPADNARDWIEGEVLFIDADEIALLRTDPEIGEVAVHFPRLGYDWRRQR